MNVFNFNMIRYKSLFFNPNLFTIDEQPIKFYLDGYSNDDVKEIARIVEAFGGKLSEPDESTIIFSEPGRPPTTNYARFHIQYLRDCIAIRELQDLEKYRIPLIRQHCMEGVIKKEFVKTDQYSDEIRFLKSVLKSDKNTPTSSNVEIKKSTSNGTVNQQLKGEECSNGFQTNCEICENDNNRRFIGKIKSASSSLGKHSHCCLRNLKCGRADNLKGNSLLH